VAKHRQELASVKQAFAEDRRRLEQEHLQQLQRVHGQCSHRDIYVMHGDPPVWIMIERIGSHEICGSWVILLADEYSDQMEGLTESMKAALRAARAGAFSSP